MADINRITLVIEGLPKDDGHVRLNEFISELQHLNSIIARMDKYANEGQVGINTRIVELSYNSPIRVVIETTSNAKFPNAGNILIENLERAAAILGGGGDILSIDADILEDFRNIARPVGKNVQSAALLFNVTRLNLTPDFIERLDNALSVAEECEGAVQGMLEQINIHQGANTFRIYPEIGPRKLTCSFPSRLYDEAISAVGRKVEVYGSLKFRARANFPHQIVVSAIESFPNEADLPDWNDLRGRAPNSTDGLLSEEFVRRLRNDWR